MEVDKEEEVEEVDEEEETAAWRRWRRWMRRWESRNLTLQTTPPSSLRAPGLF